MMLGRLKNVFDQLLKVCQCPRPKGLGKRTTQGEACFPCLCLKIEIFAVEWFQKDPSRKSTT